MVSSILDGVASIADSSDPLKIRYEGISYKPFISLFQMIGAVEANRQLAGIGWPSSSFLDRIIHVNYSELCCRHCI